ncbi:MAG: HlyD family secretion protein [Psychrobium sp.]
MKKFLPVLVVITITVFLVTLVADRLTPYTDNARIKNQIVPITPQVSGYVDSIAVQNDQPVVSGDVLLQIESSPYELEIKTAQAQLESELQNLDVDAAQVDIAQSQVVKAQVVTDNLKLQLTRNTELRRKGLVAQSVVDDKQAQFNQAQQSLDAAKATLTKSREALGKHSEENPRIKQALANLALAKLHREWSLIKAPSNGRVIDLKITAGTYAKAKTPLLMFMSTDEVWIDAYFTENNLGNMALGDRVEIILDAHPGEVFTGKIVSINGGVSAQMLNLGVTSATNSGLPSVPRMSGWMRDPQRFPVRVAIDQPSGKNDKTIVLRHNGQADVLVYSKASNGFLNSLAGVWFKILSYFSYAY